MDIISLMSKSQTTLDKIKPGISVKISYVMGSGAVRRRILEMGMVHGAEVKVIRKAPTGDPIEFEVKGYNLSMRKAEAKLVVVEILARGE